MLVGGEPRCFPAGLWVDMLREPGFWPSSFPGAEIYGGCVFGEQMQVAL